MTVGVVDSLRRVTGSQALAGRLTISVIVSAAVGGEVGRFVDKRSGLGIGTGVWGVPESAAQVNLS